MSVTVPKAVLEGILAVRDSGATNMFDHPKVVELLDDMGFDNAAQWVLQNKGDYVKGIFQGFNCGELRLTEDP